MRPFGSLPRPQSRFKRPGLSWARRCLQAVSVIITFMVLYLIFGVLPLRFCYDLARNYGYFYSSSERQALWRSMPDSEAAATLRLIYGSQPASEVMIIVQQVSSPLTKVAGFVELLQNPRYSFKAKAVQSWTFDERLSNLKVNWYTFRFEDLLAVSDNGALLNSAQRKTLDRLRRNQAEWYLTAQPDCEATVQTWRYRFFIIANHPWPLEPGWQQEMVRRCQNNQLELVKRLGQEPLSNSLALLRRLQMQTRITGLKPALVQPLTKLARDCVNDCVNIISDSGQEQAISMFMLLRVANFKKLLPDLDISALLDKLPKEHQQTVINCLNDHTINPR